MKSRNLRSIAALAVTVLVASCGGGGGSAPPAASLEVSGTAALGVAFANAAVEVKCAAGTATATTGADGSYTVTVPQGALPCVVQVTGSGTVSGIVLHSVVDSGSTDKASGVTSAKANVTPLTELVVAQLAAASPADFFAAFGGNSAGQVTGDKVAAAATAVAAALKDAGIDLAGVDPLQGELVAATGSTEGNAYDKLLDALGAKVSPEALPVLVAQIANAAATGSSSALTDAMAAVQGGGLPGCPYVLSGNYRAIDFFGRTTLRPIDFAAKTFGAGDDVNQMALVQDGTDPCAFTATLTLNGQVGEWQVAFGPGGVGIYRARIAAPTASAGITGMIFPVQSHTAAEVAGTWDFLNSGSFPGEGVQHYAGQVVVDANGGATTCDYAPTANWACQPDGTARTLAARSDGGFDLQEGATTVANVYAYRGPGGVLTLFGTTNPSGSADPAVEQTSLVLTKLAPNTLPEVGYVDKYASTLLLFAFDGTRSTTGVTSDQQTVVAVDAAAGTVQRERVDGTSDTFHLNQPIPGLREREPNLAAKRSAGYSMDLTGTGVTLMTNAAGAPGRWLAYSVRRP
jgi:hypothetical protein